MPDWCLQITASSIASRAEHYRLLCALLKPLSGSKIRTLTYRVFAYCSFHACRSASSFHIGEAFMSRVFASSRDNELVIFITIHSCIIIVL